jgi:DNA recombination protein RmuC
MSSMTLLPWLSLLLAAVSLALLLYVLKRLTPAGEDPAARIEKAVREEFRLAREESGRATRELREGIAEDFRLSREEAAHAARELREEVAATQKSANETVTRAIAEMAKSQKESLTAAENRIKELSELNRDRLDRLRNILDTQIRALQESNEKKLDQMRQTVDEKLQSTLEKRLGESFKLVSERLESVQRGLGEMQNLAAGVGDLKRVLTNVKTRGTWGEVQLGAILEQILTPDQYDKNVRTRANSADSVEYAVRLPGSGRDLDSVVWLPIDSKFPQEDYQRLLAAAEIADSAGVDKALVALTRALLNSARDIATKYLDPPRTTDFAIMFLPTEGLYAEILRQAGLVEKLQQEYRVVVTGPTTLAATLSSLRMGFRTLAIEKRSSEVWEILSAVKTEFGKFGEVLNKVKRQLATAANTIDQTEIRTRAMERKLKSVEELPITQAEKLLGLDEPGTETEELDS